MSLRFPFAVAALSLALAAPPAFAQDMEGMTAAPVAGGSLTERVWMRTDTPDLPGSMQLFLSDGTLVTDSCWETYRLSSWKMTSETELSWEEDGMTIPAEIVEIDEAHLVLALELVSGEMKEQTYEVAPVPYVCPDMPR